MNSDSAVFACAENIDIMLNVCFFGLFVSGGMLQLCSRGLESRSTVCLETGDRIGNAWINIKVIISI